MTPTASDFSHSHQHVQNRITGATSDANSYVREEELARQFAESLKQIRIPTELADKLATMLRESQTDKADPYRESRLTADAVPPPSSISRGGTRRTRGADSLDGDAPGRRAGGRRSGSRDRRCSRDGEGVTETPRVGSWN